MLLADRGCPPEALRMLEESVIVARSQNALPEIARSLQVLSDVARRLEPTDQAAIADCERMAFMRLIGPETRGLIWAQEPPSEVLLA
jgi:hypothetical protein